MALYKYDGTLAAETSVETAGFGGTGGGDTIAGSSAAEAFWATPGDRMTGGAGDDTYYNTYQPSQVVEVAGGGVDKVVGWGSISLEAYANVENLLVSGNEGRYAVGNALDNIIAGGDGAQQIYGGAGQDVLIGGAGADVFLICKGQGADVIQDFNPLEDKVRLKAGFTDFAQVQGHLTQVGADVKLDLGGGEGVMFRNLTVGQLTANDFQLQLDPSKLGVMTFSEEFNGPLSIWDQESHPTGIWRPDFGFNGPQGLGSYTLTGNGETEIFVSPYFREHPGDFPVNPFVQNPDGTLTIQARYTTNPEVTEWGYNITSGALTTRGGTPETPSFSQKYGYFEMRADLSEVPGTWGAFWLVNANYTWPPEIDILENPVGDANLAWTTVHTAETGAHTSTGVANYIPGSTQGFHTYGALWTPDTVTWYVDDVEVFQTRTPADMHSAMSFIISLSTGGWAGNPTDLSNADMTIDYIRAWALPGDSTAIPVTPPPVTEPAPPPPPVVPPADVLALPASSTPVASLLGDGRNTRLTGTDGADLIDGKGGYDTMSGGAGDDTYMVDNARDSIREDAGGGIDTVKTALSRYTLSSNVENLTLTGTGAQTGVGNSASNILTANAVRSTLNGGAGDDVLISHGGCDTMTGGSGDDVFRFEALPSANSKITDFAPGHDVLDLRPLLTGYHGADPVADGWVKFASGWAGLSVSIDLDGPGSTHGWDPVVTLARVTAPLTMQSDWVFV